MPRSGLVPSNVRLVSPTDRRRAQGQRQDSQREIDAALAERRLDAPDRYAHLQVARLTKALRLADALVDRGDLRAVGPVVKLVAALDRYHGLGRLSRLTATPLAIAPPPEMASLPQPAPPLALTRAAPPLDEVAAVAVEGTDSGA
jgi:hypothetical protein